MSAPSNKARCDIAPATPAAAPPGIPQDRQRRSCRRFFHRQPSPAKSPANPGDSLMIASMLVFRCEVSGTHTSAIAPRPGHGLVIASASSREIDGDLHRQGSRGALGRGERLLYAMVVMRPALSENAPAPEGAGARALRARPGGRFRLARRLRVAVPLLAALIAPLRIVQDGDGEDQQPESAESGIAGSCAAECGFDRDHFLLLWSEGPANPGLSRRGRSRRGRRRIRQDRNGRGGAEPAGSACVFTGTVCHARGLERPAGRDRTKEEERGRSGTASLCCERFSGSALKGCLVRRAAWMTRAAREEAQGGQAPDAIPAPANREKGKGAWRALACPALPPCLPGGSAGERAAIHRLRIERDLPLPPVS